MVTVTRPMVVISSPQATWKRFDDTNANIQYSSKNTYSASGQWGGTSNYTTAGNTIKFNFYGTKIRLMSFTYPNGRSVNSEFVLDGKETYLYSDIGNNTYMNCVLDIQGLELKEHSVFITARGDATMIDCIDVDDDGYLLPYKDVSEESILFSDNSGLHGFKRYRNYFTPFMTSATTPAPLAIINEVNTDASYASWKAFNGTNSNGNDCWVIGGTQGGATLSFGQTRSLGGFFMQVRNWSDSISLLATPKVFEVEGSMDGIRWFKMLRVENATNWGHVEERLFLFDKSYKTKYFRFKVLNNNGYASYTNIGRIRFLETEEVFFQTPKKISKENFSKYGQFSYEKMNIIFNNKNYILQDGVSENEEGLWEQEINRKPLSIKFE